MAIAKALGCALAFLVWALAMAATSASAEAERPPDAPAEDTLQASLESYLSEWGGTYGITAVNLEDGRTVSVNADTVFPTASMYKLLVMYRVYQAIESGDLSLDQTVSIEDTQEDLEEFVDLCPGDVLTIAEALNAMITVSSNSAAYALTYAVGGWTAIASAAPELGMDSTLLDGEEWFSTPADMARFFQLLASRSLVSPQAGQQMVDLLLLQTVNDRIPALLPEGVEIAHKTGELYGVRNDGGIVLGPKGPFILVTMSQEGDPEEETRAEAEISRRIFSEFGG